MQNLKKKKYHLLYNETSHNTALTKTRVENETHKLLPFENLYTIASQRWIKNADVKRNVLGKLLFRIEHSFTFQPIYESNFT